MEQLSLFWFLGTFTIAECGIAYAHHNDGNKLSKAQSGLLVTLVDRKVAECFVFQCLSSLLASHGED